MNTLNTIRVELTSNLGWTEIRDAETRRAVALAMASDAAETVMLQPDADGACEALTDLARCEAPEAITALVCLTRYLAGQASHREAWDAVFALQGAAAAL